MNPFTWNDNHSVGHPEIDADHRALFGIAEQLYDEIQNDSAQSTVGGLLSRLDSYARFHFEAEEALMRQAGSPEHAQHRREHEAFASMVSQLTSRSAEIANALMEFLRNWIEQHTCGTDRRMADHNKRVEPGIHELRNASTED